MRMMPRWLRAPRSRRTLTQGLVSLLLLTTGTGVGAYDLSQHEWRDRLLVYAAPVEGDAELDDLRQRIDTQQAAIVERHLRVFELLPDSGSVDGNALTRDDVHSLRAGLDIAADDRVLLLVGKDGGVKARGPLTTPLADVYQLIDGMPMRQREMRLQRQGRDAYR